MATLTPVVSLYIPDEGESAATWTAGIESNFNSIDTLLGVLPILHSGVITNFLAVNINNSNQLLVY